MALLVSFEITPLSTENGKAARARERERAVNKGELVLAPTIIASDGAK